MAPKSHRSARPDDRRRQYLSGGRSFRWRETTLLRTLAGLETIDSGSFLLDGKAFDPTDTKEQEQVVGVVFQDFQLFPHLSVFENITLAPKMVLKQDKAAYTAKAEQLAEKLGLSDLLAQYPFQLSGAAATVVARTSDGDESQSVGL